jgi:hypothetical protein
MYLPVCVGLGFRQGEEAAGHKGTERPGSTHLAAQEYKLGVGFL